LAEEGIQMVVRVTTDRVEHPQVVSLLNMMQQFASLFNLCRDSFKDDRLQCLMCDQRYERTQKVSTKARP
jgi:hypothetical protein